MRTCSARSRCAVSITHRPVLGPDSSTSSSADRAISAMLDLTIPAFGRLEITDAVCDYNGTLAADGRLLDGVEARIRRLSSELRVHVVTADTFGSAARELERLP